MTPQIHPGGWYAAALPSGEFAVLYPGSHVETHLGKLAFPPGESYGPMFLDIAPGRFCGLAHDTPGVILEYAPAGWREDRTVYRSGRVVYGRNGRILDTLPAGFQFVGDDGMPVERVYTVSPPRHGLNEWSETAGLLIGQGNDAIAPPKAGGVLLWDGSQHRILDSGECNFIRVHRDGEKVAISYVKSGVGAVIWQTTLSELRALPVYTPSPLPQPIPQPVPEPEPVPMPNLPDQTAVVATVRQKYPTPLGDQHGQCLLEIARAIGHGAGLLRKDAGTHVVLPDGTKVSQDIIIFPDGHIFDCLGSGETLATPSWQDKGIDTALLPRYYSVGTVVYPDPPQPQPDPGGPEDEPLDVLRAILVEVRALRRHLGA